MIVESVVDVFIGFIPFAVDIRNDARGIFQQNRAAADAYEQIVAADDACVFAAGDFQRIVCFKAVNGIVAVARAVFNRIVQMTCRETYDIVARAAANDVFGIGIGNQIIAGIAFENIAASGVLNGIGIRTAENGNRARAVVQQIGTRTAVEHIARAGIVEYVISGSAEKRVVGSAVCDGIGSRAAVDRNVRAAVDEHIVSGSAVNRNGRAVIFDRVGIFAAGDNRVVVVIDQMNISADIRL